MVVFWSGQLTTSLTAVEGGDQKPCKNSGLEGHWLASTLLYRRVMQNWIILPFLWLVLSGCNATKLLSSDSLVKSIPSGASSSTTGTTQGLAGSLTGDSEGKICIPVNRPELQAQSSAYGEYLLERGNYQFFFEIMVGSETIKCEFDFYVASGENINIISGPIVCTKDELQIAFLSSLSCLSAYPEIASNENMGNFLINFMITRAGNVLVLPSEINFRAQIKKRGQDDFVSAERFLFNQDELELKEGFYSL